ncbi:MAG: hypothetical protein QNI91_04735 [Arenicellales bacterium]|nr:hypothetical protein [Arenicellales bacterium]
MRRKMSRTQRRRYGTARRIIAAELGHGRTQVARGYLGDSDEQRPDQDENRVEPVGDNPFAPNVLPMSSV